ncbi:MAG: HD domain-containing protein [Acidobacteriota bacterium]|nr:HD domain-containing protein [Acidobacteriota bacterium]
MNDVANLIQAINFAAKKHSTQKRKGADEQPYINHILEVVNILANVGKVKDYDVLIAAVLHDTIEDTETTIEEITKLFGAIVCKYVLEVTDDKNLPKAERKQLQIKHAPYLSDGAKQIKLGDKISNIHDVSKNPPDGWSKERRLEYVDWGKKVIDGLRGVNSNLEKHFDELVAVAREAIEKP